MPKKSTRKNKNIYQLCREERNLTREKASEMMDSMPTARIERIEYDKLTPEPHDIIQMADCYRKPDLCNYYCSHVCEIGQKYVPEIEASELPNIILETIDRLNELNPLTNRLIQIAKDGKISDDEIPDFAKISTCLDEISLAVNSLNLWIDKTAGEHDINVDLLHAEKDRIRNK